MLTCKRDHFSLPDDVHYLNGAYTSPLSRTVVTAGIRGVRRKAHPFAIEPGDFFDGLTARSGRSPQLISRVQTIPPYKQVPLQYP
jgi:hypothetical protein